MFRPEEFCLSASSLDELQSKAEVIFDLVWRFDLESPGFAVVDAGPVIDSHSLRAWMVALKGWFSAISLNQGRPPFAYLSMARFDQQQTTKFHLDGAPAESLLMLGYEPSPVRSRLFLADYVRAALDMGLTTEQYLSDFNPMFVHGEEALSNYSTEIPQPMSGHSRIVLINNSSLSLEENRRNSLGVMHQAIVETPDRIQRRVINSTMLATGIEELSPSIQQDFIETAYVSQLNY